MAAFIDQLRQRKVVQWGFAYLAGAWVALQVMDVLGELFGWPISLQRTVFSLLVVGFFLALVVAWFHGDRGHQRVSGTELAVLAGVALLGGLVALGPWGSATGEGADPAGGEPPDRAALPASPGDTRPSVAVLPFRNVGGDAARAYFAAGVHEEIIVQLARVRGLRVISRNSVMRFADSELSAGEIASELGVEAIVDGGVLLAGDSVRVTTTLVDAPRDETVWSDRYDGSISDIFAIQEDVARSIVSALRATLTPEESRRMEVARPGNVGAYDLYLLSRHHFRRFGPEGLTRSVELARAALAEDSTYAPAWMALGRASMVMALGHAGVGASPADEMERARAALERALDLDPDLAEARSALALIMGTYDYDLDGAVAAARRAVESVPGDAVASEILGLLLSTVGRDDEAIEAGERAARLDPLAPVITSNLGWIYLNARRFDDAVAQAERALSIEPDFHDALTLVGRTSIRTGRYEEAVAAYRRGAEVSGGNPEDLGGMAHALARLGDREGAREILGGLLERSRNEFVAPLHVGYAYLGLGDDQAALDWFERGVEERGGWGVWLPRYPEAERLHDDPRFRSLVERMGLVHLLAGSEG